MAGSKDGYLCKTDDAWLDYQIHQRDLATTVVYYRKPYNTPFNRFPTEGPIFGCTTIDASVQLCMRGTFRNHEFLTITNAWNKYGDALGAVDLEDWREQSSRVLHGTNSDELSFTVIGNVQYFVPPINLDALSFPVTPQTMQVGRGITTNEIAELDGLISQQVTPRPGTEVGLNQIREYRLETYPDTKFYLAGLGRLEDRMSELQRRILTAHYFAPSHRATAPQLAALAGVTGGYPTVNAQYGRLGHMFCDLTGFEPDLRPDGTPKWWAVWSIGFADPDGFIWQMHENVARALESLGWVEPAAIALLPEEITDNNQLTEGTRIQIVVNAYERNRDARTKCIEHYGAICSICGFDFGVSFGEIGDGFIHVHHLTPLTAIGDNYVVDPINDLRPVCPNCHAMIHRRSPPFTETEVKDIINRMRIGT